MSKIFLIIQREFLTRVRKKSFLIMAILGPFLFALGMIVPLWLGTSTSQSKVIEVLDQTGYFRGRLPQTPDLQFLYTEGKIAQRISYFIDSRHDALLYIPDMDLNSPQGIVLYAKSRPSPEVTFFLEKTLSQTLSIEKIKQAGIDPEKLQQIETPLRISTKSIFGDWQNEEAAAASVVVALFFSILILFFIIVYGGQVMRGVIEEKTNRIVEILVSSVTPFQLMMGKIIGVACMSLVQFLIWGVLTVSITFYIHHRYEKVFEMYADEQIETTLKMNPALDVQKATEINGLMNAIGSIDFSYIIILFVFYFLGGYLLYSALFAAIGSVADIETDTQQFVFPLIAPLMFCVMMATEIVMHPHEPLAVWLSLIPFTAPVAMMLRLPFGVSTHEILLSVTVLIGTFLFVTWMAGKIYRVGILMYGKKVTLPEMIRWIFYKN